MAGLALRGPWQVPDLRIGPNQTFHGTLFVPPLSNGCTYRIVVTLTTAPQIDPLTKRRRVGRSMPTSTSPASRRRRASNGQTSLPIRRIPGYLRHARSDSLVRNSLYLMASTVVTAGLGYVFWVVAAHAFTSAKSAFGAR